MKEVLHSRRYSPDIHKFVKGLMIESYIEPGSQKIGEHCYGKSITDPCLGWEESSGCFTTLQKRSRNGRAPSSPASDARWAGRRFLSGCRSRCLRLFHFQITGFTARGRVKMNSEPTPAVLITSMFSPWAWMISFTMERPSPVPFFVLSSGKVGFVETVPDLFSGNPLGIPTPVSLTETKTFFVPGRSLDIDHGAVVAELDGIVQEVIKDLLDLSQIRVDHQYVVGKGQVQDDVSGAAGSLEGGRRVLDHPVDVEITPREIAFAV